MIITGDASYIIATVISMSAMNLKTKPMQDNWNVSPEIGRSIGESVGLQYCVFSICCVRKIELNFHRDHQIAFEGT